MNLRNLIQNYRPTCEQEERDREVILRLMNCFEDLLVRDNAIAHFTASSWIVNPDRTKALMAYHNVYDTWAWTGGHADGDEDLMRVSIREAMEETSISSVRLVREAPISMEVLPVVPHIKRGKYVSAHVHLNLTWLLEADESMEIRSKPDENKAVRWFPLDEAVKASAEPHMRIIYAKLNQIARNV